ncbi:MAG TPA: tetratricopeptide repeat protein [Lacipirellulaceae bacterium]|nr:tetratricopeptide repeat protein [Lacipirellulaceae bacterium]
MAHRFLDAPVKPACRWARRRRGALAGLLVAVAAGGCNQMNSQALNSEGVRLYQLGNYQQAADQFQRAIVSDPRSATSYYNLAAALHKSGKLSSRPNDLAQAERLYNQCLEYDPNHAECYRGLAVLLSETGRQDAAFRLLEGWAGRSPQLADPRIELARLLEESNNLEQASGRLVEALSIDPHNSRALTALGRLREVSGDRAQALANYQRSLSINRFQPEIATRVAALQAAGAGAATSPMVTLPGGTRTATEGQSMVRY